MERKTACHLALLLLVLLGIAGVMVFGLSALQDWRQLQVAQARFEQVAASDAGMREVFVAHAKQDIHRTNLFAEGVWTLLSAVIAAIGVHGLCTSASEAPSTTDPGRASETPATTDSATYSDVC